MTIGKLARQANVNPRTLRYYERIGLLAPSTRTAAGYRLYTDHDATRLTFIRRAQALGLSLTEIAAVIDARLAALQALRDELTALADRAEAVEMTCIDAAGICSAIERTLTRSS
jgi:DNA-binding transcriptional MerR regulator